MNMGVKNGMFSSVFQGNVTNSNAGISNVGFQAKKREQKKAKKQLNYNPREISSQIVRAKKAQNASAVLVRAKSRLGVLQRALASGEYNEGEVRTAIMHARRMVECSRMKVKNLKQEEQMAGKNARQQGTERQKKKIKAKQLSRKRLKERQTEAALEESQRMLKEKTMRQELYRMRRMHRNEERGKISEAELKYLEDQMRQNGGNTTMCEDGVIMELGQAAWQASQLEMTEQAMNMEAAAIDPAVSVEAAVTADAGVSMPAAVSVDVSI